MLTPEQIRDLHDFARQIADQLHVEGETDAWAYDSVRADRMFVAVRQHSNNDRQYLIEITSV